MKNTFLLKTVTVTLLFAGIALQSHAGVGEQSIQPLLIGSDTPSADLHDAEGNSFELRELTEGKPTLVIFYRGGWCPYCSAHLRELVDIKGKIKKLGYQVIAISPDAPSKLQSTAEQGKLGYTIYSDSTLAAAEAFGIAYTLDQRTLARYQSKNRLTNASEGVNKDKLPVPSVFVLTENGKIAFQYADPNFRARIPAKLLLAAAESGLDFHKD